MFKRCETIWTLPLALAALALALPAAAGLALAQPAHAATPKETVEMHRLYNPNSGEHFYTASAGERDHLVSVGWGYEGVGWNAPVEGGDVYRLYNPNAGDHHYTASAGERDMLVSVGWSYEGVGWKTNPDMTVPLYRQYNPNAAAGSHNYTTSKGENDMLVGAGWRAEGVAWHGCAYVGETGHYEEVVVTAAYDEQVPVYEDPHKTYCNVCQADLTDMNHDAFLEHQEKHILAHEGSGWHTGSNTGKTPPLYYETVHHDAVTEQQWVVDVPGHWE